MTAQRQFQATAHGQTVQGHHHRLGGVLHGVDHGVQVGFGKGQVGAEFLDVGPAAELLAGAVDDDGADVSVLFRLAQGLHEGLAGSQAQPVHGRVVESDDGHRAALGEMRCHGLSLRLKFRRCQGEVETDPRFCFAMKQKSTVVLFSADCRGETASQA